jgi:hypothetical protein
VKAKFRHDADGMDVDTTSIGRGSGNGTIQELRRAIDHALEKKGEPSRKWLSRSALEAERKEQLENGSQEFSSRSNETDANDDMAGCD